MEKFKIGEIVKLLNYTVAIVKVKKQKLIVCDVFFIRNMEHFSHLYTEVWKGMVKKTGEYLTDDECKKLKITEL
jgi:hypothetical protein